MKLFCFLLAPILALVSAKDLKTISELEFQAHEEVKIVYEAFREISFQKKQFFPVTLSKFQFTNCADPSTETVVPRDIALSPDPVKLPGNITASGGVLVKAPFGPPFQADVKVWKKVLGTWIEIPCIDNFGSCSYLDFCTILNPPTCPPEFVKIGLNCKCPFAAGNWTVPPVTVDVKTSLPVKVTGGIRARLSGTYKGKFVTCGQVEFDLA